MRALRAQAPCAGACAGKSCAAFGVQLLQSSVAASCKASRLRQRRRAGSLGHRRHVRAAQPQLRAAVSGVVALQVITITRGRTEKCSRGAAGAAGFSARGDASARQRLAAVRQAAAGAAGVRCSLLGQTATRPRVQARRAQGAPARADRASRRLRNFVSPARFREAGRTVGPLHVVLARLDEGERGLVVQELDQAEDQSGHVRSASRTRARAREGRSFTGEGGRAASEGQCPAATVPLVASPMPPVPRLLL